MATVKRVVAGLAVVLLLATMIVSFVSTKWGDVHAGGKVTPTAAASVPDHEENGIERSQDADS